MKQFRSQRGSALVLTLVITMIILVVGSSMVFALTSETQMSLQSELQLKASYLAQAGLEHCIKLLSTAPSGQIPSYPTDPIKVSEVGSRVEEYQIVISSGVIQATGRIKENGSMIKEVTIKASWDSSGSVSIIP